MKTLNEMTTKELREKLSKVTGNDYTSKDKKFYLGRLLKLEPAEEENNETDLTQSEEETNNYACKVKIIKDFDDRVNGQLCRIYKETDGKAVVQVQKLQKDLTVFNQNGPLKNCLVLPWECLANTVIYFNRKAYKK